MSRSCLAGALYWVIVYYNARAVARSSAQKIECLHLGRARKLTPSGPYKPPSGILAPLLGHPRFGNFSSVSFARVAARRRRVCKFRARRRRAHLQRRQQLPNSLQRRAWSDYRRCAAEFATSHSVRGTACCNLQVCSRQSRCIEFAEILCRRPLSLLARLLLRDLALPFARYLSGIKVCPRFIAAGLSDRPNARPSPAPRLSSICRPPSQATRPLHCRRGRRCVPTISVR